MPHQSVTSARIHALINGCIFVRRLQSFHLHPLWSSETQWLSKAGSGVWLPPGRCKVIHWGAEKPLFSFPSKKVRQAFIFTAQCHLAPFLVQRPPKGNGQGTSRRSTLRGLAGDFNLPTPTVLKQTQLKCAQWKGLQIVIFIKLTLTKWTKI